ncbi:MAG TPA: nuclear transport factor 2 family protein [Pseudolabrys sp.]
MTQESTRTALDDLIDAFMRGDNERLAARYHDDIDWLFHAPVSIFPFAGARRGKAEVFKGFALLYETYRVTGYSVEVKLVEGDRAATLSDAHMVQRATGRTIQSRIAGFHRFQDGKMIEYRGFTDSFDSVEQALGRELQL